MDLLQAARLDGRVAIVTGASRGIGRELSLALAGAGASVVLASRNIELAAAVAAEIEAGGGQALAVRCDVSDEAAVAAMVEAAEKRFGRIDILVNNAGDAGATIGVQDLSLQDWRYVIDSSLTSAYLCCRFAVPAMIRAGGGRIINISSTAGKVGLPFRAGYCAAKAGVIGLTRGLAVELGRHGITVNSVVPGAIEGARIEHVIEQQARQRGISPAEVRDKLTANSPLRRFATAEDVAGVVLLLASDLGANITGEDINVNAGAAMG